MGLFHNRVLGNCCLLFLLGALAALFFAGWVKLLFVGLIPVALAVWVAVVHRSKKERKERPVLRVAIPAVFLLLAFLSSYLYFDVYVAGEVVSLAGDRVTVTAVVTEQTGQSIFSPSYRIRTLTVNGEGKHVRMLLAVEGMSSVALGDIIEFSATPEGLTEFSEDRETAAYHIADGDFLSVTVYDASSIRVVGSDLTDFEVGLSRVRIFCATLLHEAVGGDEGGLVSAVFLGEKSALCATDKRDFRRAGLSHMLAISGLHVSILLGVVDKFLKALFLPRKFRLPVLCVFLLGYLVLTGFAVSAVRAVCMALAAAFAYDFHGDTDPLTVLGTVAAGMVLLSPTTVADASFWLSVTATFGILAWGIRLDEWIYDTCLSLQKRGFVRSARRHHRLPDKKLMNRGKLFGRYSVYRWVMSGISVGVCASLPLLIPMSIFFDEVSFVSPFATVLLTPWVSLALCGAVLLLPMLILHIPAVPSLLAELISRTVFVTRAFVSALADAVTPVSVDGTYFLPIVCLSVAGVLILSALDLGERKRALIALPAVAGAVAFAICLTVGYVGETGVRMTYLQTTGNSEMLVLCDRDAAVIVDFSDGYYGRFREAAEEVRASGKGEVRSVVLTHYHTRHISGLRSLASVQTVREVWMPVPEELKEYRTLDSITREAERLGLTVYLYGEGQSLELLGGTYFSVRTAPVENSVQDTFLATVTRGDKTYCYFGSAVEESDLAPLAREYAATADGLIVGIHGPAGVENGTPLRHTTAAEWILVGNERDLSSVTVLANMQEEHLPQVVTGQKFTVTME